jgi:hypothetical protein
MPLLLVALIAPATARAELMSPVARGASPGMVELTATGGAAGDGFGAAVAVDGDTVVIGASGANGFRGTAYVFVRSGGVWSQQAQLTPAGLTTNAYFGTQVAVSGDTAVVAAPQQAAVGSYSGAVYVFVRSGDTWSQQAELTASDEAASDAFGESVAIDGDTAVVGMVGDSSNVQAGGAAYVFTRSGSAWTQQQKLVSADLAAYDNMGNAVAVSGDTVLVGARLHDATATDAGAAYVFTRSGTVWSPQAELTNSDAAQSDYFGTSVALDGDTAVVGSLHHGGRGAGYVFTRLAGVWTQQSELPPMPPTDWNGFTAAVAVDGPIVLVGSNSVSAADVFIDFPSGWAETGSLVGGGRFSGDVFGKSVAMSGTTGLAGAPGTTTSAGAGAGAAWVADLTPRLVRTIVTGVPGWWTKTSPVTATLTSESAVGTIVSTEYRDADDAAWTTYATPFPCSNEGESLYVYRATDSVGDVSDSGTFLVRIDTHRPTTKALAAATVVKGKTATLRYKVVDAMPGSGTADVTIKIRKGSRTVKTLPTVEVNVNQKLSARFKCKLAKGIYTFTVYAVDLALNKQSSAGHARLTVK